jgi:hypothetical protein
MKRITLLLIFLHCFLKTSAQNTFEKVIDTLGCYDFQCIQETYDGGYVLVGRTLNNNGEVCITKLDSIGTIEWVKIFDGPGVEKGTYIEQLPDSGYIVNGQYDGGLTAKSWLIRLDVYGDTLWTRILSSGSGATKVEYGNSMSVLNNSVFGLTGYYQPNVNSITSPFFQSVLGNGLLIANKVYNFSNTLGSDIRAIDKTFDFGFIMTGTMSTSSTTTDIYLLCINAYGDTLWTLSTDNYTTEVASAVQQTIDSNFIIGGFVYDTTLFPPKNNAYLFKIDTLGNVLWTKQYRSHAESTIQSIEQTSDGGYIATGRIVNGNPLDVDVYLLKTDSLGDTLWTRQFGGNWSDEGYFVRQTKDGGYIICGTGSYSGASTVGAYIIKTNDIGQLLTGLEGPELNNPFLFEVFPNPSKGVFSICIKGLPIKNCDTKIYNILNECVYSCQLTNNSNEQIHLEDLASGMYVVNLFVNHQVYSIKIIIQR